MTKNFELSIEELQHINKVIVSKKEALEISGGAMSNKITLKRVVESDNKDKIGGIEILYGIILSKTLAEPIHVEFGYKEKDNA